MMRFAGIVLCGGRSSRMGVAKAELPFGDESLLQRVVRTVSTVVSPVIVVAAEEQPLPPLPADIRIAVDHVEARGPLGGIQAGLTALDTDIDAAYVTSCDVPFLKPSFIARMLEELGEHDIAVPKEDRFAHPMAAVYRRKVLAHVSALLEQDRLRPVFLFDEVSTKYVPIETLRGCDPELDSLVNLNHPQDYLTAISKAGLDVPASLMERLKGQGG